jgi:hypothetical protein
MTQTGKFNRSKFKDSVNSEELKAADKVVEDVTRQGQSGHYAGFLKIENGSNKFLIYPSHESIQQMMNENNEKEIQNEPFVVPKQVYWLPREVEDKDDKGEVKKDKKGKPLTTVKNMPVYDARIHSELKRDIVDHYITCLKAQLEEEIGSDDDAKAKIKELMLSVYGSYPKQVKGIIGKPSWIMYAQKLVGDQKVFGRVECGKAVKMGVNDIIAIEESNQPIGSESNNPLTDIEDRRALIITYNDKAEKSTDYYKVSIDTSYNKTDKRIITYPLSDADLEEFLQYPSLSSLYKHCYTQKDFDLALEGLRLFDDKNEFNVFSNPDFLDEAEEMRKLYPEPKQEEQTPGETINESEGDKFDNMDREEMKKYSRENKTGIAIHSKLIDEDLRAQLKEWEKANTSSEVDEKIEDEDEDPAPSSSKDVSTKDIDAVLDKKPGLVEKNEKALSTKERIAKIKAGVKP